MEHDGAGVQGVLVEDLLGLRIADGEIGASSAAARVLTEGGDKTADIPAAAQGLEGRVGGGRVTKRKERGNDKESGAGVPIQISGSAGPVVVAAEDAKDRRQRDGSTSPTRNELPVGMERKEGRDQRGVGGVVPGKHVTAGAGGGLALPPEMESFSRAYLGLYQNLAEAKGVPFGSISRTAKSTDEGEKDSGRIRFVPKMVEHRNWESPLLLGRSPPPPHFLFPCSLLQSLFFPSKLS